MKTFARVLAIAVALALAACGNPNNGRMQGWIEGDFVFVGPDEMGRVEMLNVREGDQVSNGAPLFSVDADLQQSDVNTTAAQVAEARARLQRLEAAQQRKEEIMVLRAQTGPVFQTYRGEARIDSLVADALTNNPPLYDFVANDDIRHTIWRVPNYQPLVEAFAEVPYLYIADGHHRAASAGRARAELKEHGFGFIGNEEYNFFLCVIFPDNQLQILPYNRIVRDLNGMSRSEFLARLRESFELTESASPSPKQRGEWSMYLDAQWYGLALPNDAARPEGLVDSLDVSILQTRLLDPILDVKDVRTDKRIDFVGGIRGTGELEKLVKEGKAAVAFSLYPTTIDDLLHVSDAGEIMPPKSTWFEPKLRDGLLIHQI